MKILDYYRMAVSIFFRRRWAHFIELIIVFLSTCVIIYSMVMWYVTYESILAIDSLVEQSIYDVYSIQFDDQFNISSTGSKLYCDFVNDLVEDSRYDASGRYFYSNELFENEESEQISSEVLYMDSELLPLAGIKSVISGETINLESERYTGVAVGDNYRNRMPIGSLWYNPLCGVTYEVTDYIKENQKWFNDYMVNGSGKKNLNNVIVVDITKDISEDTFFLVGYSFINNIYVVANDMTGDFILEDIQEKADKYMLPVYVTSVGRMKDQYIKRNAPFFKKINLQVCIFLLMSVVGLYLINLILYEIQKSEIHIRALYGMTYKQGCVLYCIVRALPYFLGMLIGFWYQSNASQISSLLDYDEWNVVFYICIALIAFLYVLQCIVFCRRLKMHYIWGIK